MIVHDMQMIINFFAAKRHKPSLYKLSSLSHHNGLIIGYKLFAGAFFFIIFSSKRFIMAIMRLRAGHENLQRSMKKFIGITFLLLLITLLPGIVIAQQFQISGNAQSLTILYDKTGPKLDSVCAGLLADDIQRVTDERPAIRTSANDVYGQVIVIGNIASRLVKAFLPHQSILNRKLQGSWETFALKVVDHPNKHISQALVISGSDTRGTAYGVFTISDKIGVSPWYWWADVAVNKTRHLILSQPEYISAPPSIKYRGIFINDEDWGLRPWASHTFEPEVKNIGPKTYAKVFELLLRLKANFIWPAMHPGTSAFYSVPGNKETAALYNIVIGSSHAEPLLRNNVGEWNEKTMGNFNYLTNKTKVDQYWEERVKESSGNDVVYTTGMRGVHDGQMEGVKTAREAVPLLQQIIEDQRDLLLKYNHKDITTIPQVFTPYKEVLDFYDNGLQVPSDITLVWPDDNYGYIQRLSDSVERKRSGSSGVYYHISYWGRPHDYLWLSTTHPSLIREEMMKAYNTGANRLWVVNVGDIKPMEYNIQFFMDMAYNVLPFRRSSYTHEHLSHWYTRLFPGIGSQVSKLMWLYYNLAFERRPEFMGWSQTEPNTSTSFTAYNHFNYGDEGQRRIDDYNNIEKQVQNLWSNIGSTIKSPFYQLVYYPIVGSAEMNKKFLYRDKAWLYSKQNRISSIDYLQMSIAAYEQIVKATDYYNDTLSGGKWKNMMSMKPRGLAVFDPPETIKLNLSKTARWAVAAEGSDTAIRQKSVLPEFVRGVERSHFIDVFLTDSAKISWNAQTSGSWIKISLKNGRLESKNGKKQTRIWVTVDWTKTPRSAHCEGYIDVSGAGDAYRIKVEAYNTPINAAKNINDFLEESRYLSIYAQHYSEIRNQHDQYWQKVDGLGHTGKSVIAESKRPMGSKDTLKIKTSAAYVTYHFYTQHDSQPDIYIYTLPTLPLNKSYQVRCAFSIDNGPLHLLNFKSNSTARTQEWKQNVLSNQAVRTVPIRALKKGAHYLKIYAVDPGVILDRIIIDLGGYKPNYGVVPETRLEF
ncbi:glycosyl hydrolase 115 family protein [Mucilaginibacter sp. cycad4]|uniref:glycosyl hydrolase 115 family protein n=1 Tax=Mucilaginibacter sp. cycad4 TaxID=3342096 RepID=UPI002AAA7CE1|nr:glycosyl hydrolase 115 family protein [Mucilaginibacter gossypii]WPU98423.1 glycosyl hydrolase 115 family protein [Mucilaginibacter gossypii]